MIELQIDDPDPIETALLEWFPAADLYRAGTLVHKGVNLLGSNEVVGKRWAKVLAGRLADGTPTVEELAAFLRTREASQHVRAYSQAPVIAEGILTMLTERGLQ